jgi:hypothetical protein
VIEVNVVDSSVAVRSRVMILTQRVGRCFRHLDLRTCLQRLGTWMQYMMVNNTSTTADMAPTSASTSASTSLTRAAATGAPASTREISGGHRRHVRTRAEAVIVKLRVGQGVLVAKVDDISVGGFFATTDHAIPVGAFVELSLLSPGMAEVSLGGVVVDDTSHRRGLAVRFEAMSAEAARAVSRLVDAQHDRSEGADPDRGVEPARAMGALNDVAVRDHELEQLRRQVAALKAENEQLRVDARSGHEAISLVGRLQLEVERLKQQQSGGVCLDVATLGDIKRDAEVAWTAIARLTDAVGRLR